MVVKKTVKINDLFLKKTDFLCKNGLQLIKAVLAFLLELYDQQILYAEILGSKRDYDNKTVSITKLKMENVISQGFQKFVALDV